MLGLWREAEEIEIKPAGEDGRGRFRGRREAIAQETGEDEGVDGIARPLFYLALLFA